MLLRFQVADALKIPVDHPVMENVLAKLKSDNEWDVNVPMEKIMKELGEKRYELSGAGGFSETSVREQVTEVLSSKIGGSSSSSGLQVEDKKEVVEVKIENPNYFVLQTTLKALKSGKGNH